MEIIKPKIVSILFPEDALEIIEQAARTCYKSEDKIKKGSAEKLVKMLIARGHEAMLEFADATVKIICDRGVTHEIVRHRIASYAQESTRYCNYGKLGVTFMYPSDFEFDEDDLLFLEAVEKQYNDCLEKGRTPQQARYFLINGLKTEINMKMNFREWRHFFKLRTDTAAHPDMRYIAGLIKDEFKFRCPEIFY